MHDLRCRLVQLGCRFFVLHDLHAVRRGLLRHHAGHCDGQPGVLAVHALPRQLLREHAGYEHDQPGVLSLHVRFDASEQQPDVVPGQLTA